MQIEDRRIFRLTFPFIAGTAMAFDIVAESKEEAVVKLQDWMQKTMVEISIQFPKIENKPNVPSVPIGVFMPQEVMELKISTLATDLGKFGFKQGKNTKETVEKLTKVDYVPQNYPEILTQLEKIKKDAEDVKEK